MAYTFFDELGVEPLCYVGQAIDLKLHIPDVIHKLYSGNKLNVLTRYVCGRYLNTPKDVRYLETPKESRFVQTPLGNCK